MDFWIKAAQLLLSLSILVVLHEFGHYLTARYFKIRVEKFYLFFNPWFSLFKKKIGETEWGIGWLPLGGFVKISGMIDESMDKEQMAQPAQPWEFRSKPAWQRLIVMIGGVVVNLIVGVVIYILVLFTWGEEQVQTKDLTVGLAIHPYMEKFDLHSGDNILKIDGENVVHTNDITNNLLLRDKHVLTVQRPDGKIEKITLPDEIDHELFANGALPVAGLRNASTEIGDLITIDANSEIGYGTSDIVLSVNDQKASEVDYSSTDFLKLDKYVVKLKSGKDTVSFEWKNAEFKKFLKSCPALSSGLKKNDIILSIDDRQIHFFDEIVAALYHAKKKNALISVLRGQDTVNLSVPISEKKSIGFAVEDYSFVDSAAIHTVHYSFGGSFGRGISRGYTTLTDYVSQLKFLFTKKGASSIGGFGAIGNMFPPVWDWQIFWLNTALISIILAFMNILPIPALDGGHVVFLLYEIITGKEAPQKVLEYAQYIGFFLLIGLVLYANGNDIYRAIFGG